MSKELNAIFEAIEKWTIKHKGKVEFIGDFMAFKGKDFKVIDDRLIAYGIKSNLKLALQELRKNIDKEKGEFVNW